MERDNEIYFGDKNTFAIRYVAGYTDKNKKYFFAYCHLVLGGQIIGNKEETCYLNSWKYSFQALKNHIKNNFSSISHAEFENRNDRDLFELIWKANQNEDNYKPEFAHLPVLDYNVWKNCCVLIDETIDAFLITMTELDGKIKILWEGWREPCPIDKINKLYSIVVEQQFVVETMEECLRTIEKEYLNYPISE